MTATLDLALKYREIGLAVHWLYPEQKRPVGEDWSTVPVASVRSLESTYQDGNNVGIRLGKWSEIDGDYVHVIDVDIRKSNVEDEALEALDELFPGWEDFVQVESGSRSGSFHIYFKTDKPFTSRKLAYSPNKIKVTKPDGKPGWKREWEIELFGTGKQVAAPPSIHPDTGKKYRMFDGFSLLDLSDGHYVPSIDVDAWVEMADERKRRVSGPQSTRSSAASSLSSAVKGKKVDLDEDQIWTHLEALDHDEWCFDYYGWLTVGMALHHQYDGSDHGLDLWHDFSQAAANYDEDALDEKWKSFGKGNGPTKTFRTIIEAARPNLMAKAVMGKSPADLDSDDPLVDLDWFKQLEFNQEGGIRPSLHNVSLIVANDIRWKEVIATNELDQTEVIIKESPERLLDNDKKQYGVWQMKGRHWELDARSKGNGKLLEDPHMDDIRAAIEAPLKWGGYGVRVTDRDLIAAIGKAGRTHGFHPIREYLDGVMPTWDGKERVETLFIDYLGTPDTPYYREIAELFLVGACARVYFPGHKFDNAVILEGGQGIGKSTFIRTLAVRWFNEFTANFGDTAKIVENLRGVWIAELPELSQFGRGEIEDMKQFFSASEDKVRLAYARKDKIYYRQTVFMGSTNNKTYLRDTENRRFWPVHCEVNGFINTPKLAREVDQIWAEAMVLYQRWCDEYSYMRLPLAFRSEEAKQEAVELQAERKIQTEVDTWIGKLEAWLDEPVSAGEVEFAADPRGKRLKGTTRAKREKVCAIQAWVEGLGYDERDYKGPNPSKCMAALRALPGWEERGQMSTKKWGRQRAFVRIHTRRSKADLLGTTE